MKLLNIIFIVLITLGLSLPGVNAKPVFAEITDDMSRSFNEGKIAELTGLYTADAVVMPPSSEILTGRDAIATYWNALRQAGFSEYNVYSVELRPVGDVAYQTGLWEAVRKDQAGNIIRLSGNISNVLTREKNGVWKIKLQSWN